MNGWDLPGLEPVAIQVKAGPKFELHRRVTAESVSRGTYILAEIGSIPIEEEFAKIATEALAEDVGIVLPGGFRSAIICRKGVITHWPTPRTSSYVAEHNEAYSRLGYKTISCPLIHCRPLVESLPS